MNVIDAVVSQTSSKFGDLFFVTTYLVLENALKTFLTFYINNKENVSDKYIKNAWKKFLPILPNPCSEIKKTLSICFGTVVVNYILLTSTNLNICAFEEFLAHYSFSHLLHHKQHELYYFYLYVVAFFEVFQGNGNGNLEYCLFVCDRVDSNSSVGQRGSGANSETRYRETIIRQVGNIPFIPKTKTTPLSGSSVSLLASSQKGKLTIQPFHSPVSSPLPCLKAINQQTPTSITQPFSPPAAAADKRKFLSVLPVSTPVPVPATARTYQFPANTTDDDMHYLQNFINDIPSFDTLMKTGNYDFGILHFLSGKDLLLQMQYWELDAISFQEELQSFDETEIQKSRKRKIYP
jgi:hypothetical protein